MNRPVRKIVSFVLVTLAFAARGNRLSALDGGNIPFTARPSWVKPLEFNSKSAIDDALVDNGFYYILNDQQCAVQSQEHYRHFAYRVINHSGLEEASRIEISYEPTYQTLALHEFRIWRDGKPLEYGKRIRWKELQQESALMYGQYDETRTMLLILEDIRTGDVVEYDYTIRGSNPIFAPIFYGTFHHGLDYPMATLSFRLVLPPGRAIATRQHVRELPFTETALPDGGREIVWSERDSPAVRENKETPDWYEEYPWIEISEWKDWAQVQAWGCSVFAGASATSSIKNGAETPEKAYQKIAERARAEKGTDLTREEKLLAVLRFVQDEIRYFGIEVGVNSHRPRSPEEVLDSRFGDCKDKALLFCRMARLAGWDAWPTLVNSSLGESVGEWLPSPQAFDHVIVAVRDRDRLLWFDPTISYQGGSLGDTWVPDYGKALILDGASRALTAMPAEKPGDVDVHETYISSGYEKPGTLEVVSVFRGHEADRMRYQLASTGRTSLEENYLDFYQTSFPKAERTGDVTSADDRSENELEIRESYSIPELWSVPPDDGGNGRELYLDPYTFSRRFSDFDDIGASRSAPLALSNPWKARHRITVYLPEDMSLAAEEYKSDNPWYNLEFRAKQDGLAFELDYSYEPLVETIDAADFPAFRTKLESDRKGYLGYTLFEKRADDATEDADKASGGNTSAILATIALLALTACVSYRLGVLHGREKP